MSSTLQERKRSLCLPGEDARAVDELAAQTRVPFNRIVSLCVRKGLPSVRADLSAKSGRVTNVDPLPDKVLDRLYRARDEDGESIRRFIAAQPKGAE